MRHLLVVGLWLAVYYAPILISTLLAPTLAEFYTLQVLSSVVLALGLYQIDAHFPGGFWSSLTILGIMLSTSFFAVFNSGLFGAAWRESGYDFIQNGLNTVELLLLIGGAGIGIWETFHGLARTRERHIYQLLYFLRPAMDRVETK